MCDMSMRELDSAACQTEIVHVTASCSRRVADDVILTNIIYYDIHDSYCALMKQTD